MSNRHFNVLVVEDDSDIADFIASTFKAECAQVNISIVSSRDEAFELLGSGAFFDYVTLDLSIPDVSGSFEKDASNGLAVLGKVIEVSAGTPILILTGTSTPDMFQDFLGNSNQVDIWGTGKERGTIEHLTKTRIGELSDKIKKAYSEFSSILEVELLTGAESLPIEHDRLIRVFTNFYGGSLGEVRQIGGGLSVAKVYSVQIKDTSGCIIHRAICKCGPKEDIKVDADNYQSFINRLKPEATPRILGHFRYAAGSICGVFYGLAENYDDSFFGASLNVVLDEELETSIKSMLVPWHSSSRHVRKTIRDIRQQLVTDETATKLYEQFNLVEAHAFESQGVNCKVSCTHGDFHGENILLDVPSKKATLIDYGDVSEGVSIIDPLTLECSFLFHPATIGKLGSWPTKDNLANWENLDAYVDGCPVEKSIRFCREWAYEIGVGNRELAASLYSYALRQLKYDDTDKEIAISLIGASYRLYEQS
ncbi:response regulator [Photobacterium damselae]|uniref:response regulator n=1 Tax=Photobacterium damselae TaxID=38293 RepID=UPI001F27C0A0|nr:response regulator [Photobacterium damselae]UKA01951.1 response regulator [Photobacterium damselae subsp. damselae]